METLALFVTFWNTYSIQMHKIILSGHGTLRICYVGIVVSATPSRCMIATPVTATDWTSSGGATRYSVFDAARLRDFAGLPTDGRSGPRGAERTAKKIAQRKCL